jgi:hypothetical protein
MASIYDGEEEDLSCHVSQIGYQGGGGPRVQSSAEGRGPQANLAAAAAKWSWLHSVLLQGPGSRQGQQATLPKAVSRGPKGQGCNGPRKVTCDAAQSGGSEQERKARGLGLPLINKGERRPQSAQVQATRPGREQRRQGQRRPQGAPPQPAPRKGSEQWKPEIQDGSLQAGCHG